MSGRRLGVIFSYILFSAEVLSTLIFTPFLIRSLGQAEYGLYSLVASVTAYFLLLDGGVGNALIRYIAKYRVGDDTESQNQLLGLSLTFYSAIGVTIVVLGWILRSNVDTIFGGGLTGSELDLLRTMLTITVANASLSLIFSAFDRIIIAYEHFVLSKCLAIARLLMRVLIVTTLLVLGYRAVAVVAVNLVLTVAFGMLTAVFVFRRLRLRPVVRGMRFGFVSEVLGYTAFIFLQMVATQVNTMTDQVLLGIMTNSATIGVYAVGAQLSAYYQSIAAGINGVVMPGVVRLVETGAEPGRLLAEMTTVSRLVLVVLGPVLVVFAVVGRRFVELWVGHEYTSAYSVALILMAALTLVLAQSVGSQILWAMGRHKEQAFLNVGVALLNVALTAALIRWRPLVGASLGTAAAYLVGDVLVMDMMFRRHIRVSIREYYTALFAGVVPALVVAGLAGLLASLLGSPGWWSVLVPGTCSVLVYVMCMHVFGFSDNERRLVRSLLSAR